MPKIPAEVLTAALEGLEAQKARIDEQIAGVRALMGRRGPGRPPAAEPAEAPTKSAPGRRKRRRSRISPEGLARIVAATKKRWAKLRQAATKKVVKKAKPAAAKKARPRKKAARKPPAKAVETVAPPVSE
jgi:hypothetical protein